MKSFKIDTKTGEIACTEFTPEQAAEFIADQQSQANPF